MKIDFGHFDPDYGKMSSMYLYLLKLIQLFRHGLLPFILFLSPLVPFISRRLRFERKNRNYIKKGKAYLAFQVSSEGELEQALPLIVHYLEDGKEIELIYTSESVEKKVGKLLESFSKLYAYRMPLLSFGIQNINNFLTADTLILCRYDFFPELLLYGQRKGKRLVLISATFKGKEKKLLKSLKRWQYSSLYRLFDEIIVAREIDKNILSELTNSKSIFCDFRFERIQDRLSAANEVFAKNEPLALYREYLHHFEGKKLCFGSFWPNEAAALRNSEIIQLVKDKKLTICLAPHKLGEESFSQISRLNLDLPIYHIKKDDSAQSIKKLIDHMEFHPGIIVSWIPGILCEFYSLFDYAYVGGGHGRSIHSVLEPYLANCIVGMGPKTYRSTEYDLIKNNTPQSVVVVKELERDILTLLEVAPSKDDLVKREELIEKVSLAKIDVLKVLDNE